MLGSLRFRIAVAFVLLIVAAFAALGLYVLDRMEGDFRDSIKDDLTSQAQMVGNLVRSLLEEGDPPQAFDRMAKLVGQETGTRVTIIAPDGTVLGDSEADPATMDNHLDRPEVQEAIRLGRGDSSRHSATLDVDFTYVAAQVILDGDVVGFVRVARPSESVNASLSGITRSILVAVVVTAGTAAVLGLAIGTTVTRPLSRLARAARAMAAGNLSERVSPRPSGEVGELADAFNQMAQSVEELLSSSSEGRNRLIAVLDSSADAVVAVDADGRISFANLAAEQLFSRSQGDLMGMPFGWVMPNEEAIEALRASRDQGRQETRLVERAGGQCLQVVTTPISGGGDWTALAVIHDLTEMRRTERVRRDFVANVSHELRTPLAAIKSVVETLLGGAIDDKPAAQRFLSQADAEVDRLAQMMEELLELSRIESGDVPLAHESVDLSEILTEAVERLRRQAERQRLVLQVDVSPDLPRVMGDAERLQRATTNLVHNAIKFTPAGGSVRVSATPAGEFVTVKVSDTGVGIALEDLPRVFERFYKADRSRGSGGTGLGLAVVKHTVEAHGGTVAVESELNRGSTFSFSIPVAPGSQGR